MNAGPCSPQHNWFWGGVGGSGEARQGLLAIRTSRCGAVDTRKKFFGTNNRLALYKADLAGARPPRLTAKLSKPRCPPGGAFPLELTQRALGWRTKLNQSQN